MLRPQNVGARYGTSNVLLKNVVASFGCEILRKTFVL